MKSSYLTHRFTGPLALLCALATARLVAQSTPAASGAAHDPRKPDEAVKLEAFQVTGSNIKRLEIEKVLPVTIFNRDLIDGRNALTPVEMLTALPQVTSVPLNESTSGGANSRGDNANINLRGVGSGSTLVLLNGRRVAPHPVFSPDGSNPNSFSVNVNQLPTQGLERIDVLRDGASSIYGSDAVAGVINYITRRDFRGTELRTRFGVPEHGGGESVQATLTHGLDFNNAKGRWLTTLDYLYRNPILFTERERTKSADHRAQAAQYLAAFPNAFDGRSTLGVWPRYTVPTGATTTRTEYFRPGVPGTTATGTPTFQSSAPRLADNPESVIDINTFQNLGQTRSERVNWFNSFEYDFSDRLTAFADISFYHSNTNLVRQPIPFNAPGSDRPAPLSIDNPFNPYGSRYNHPTGAPNADGTPRVARAPTAITLTGLTLIEAGGEDVIVNSGIYRAVAGLRGKLGADWNWELGGLYTRAYTADISKNAVRESALREALMRTNNTAFNPFRYTFRVVNNAVVPDQPYANPQGVLDGFVQVWRHDGFSSIGSGDLRVSGPLLRYWGNTLSLAGGAEYRKEAFRDYRPPYAGTNPPDSGLSLDDNDYVQASPKFNFTGERTVYSGYLETIIPITQQKHDVPLLHSLEFTASARYENYSDFGTTTKPKFGANWRPYRGLMFRGSYNEGFAAANLPTLYQPAQFTVDSLPGQTDQYRSAAGLTTGEVTYVQRNYSSGNTQLLPVESKGKSVGLVFEVPGVKGLSITADYWQIKQENEISIRSASQILNRDSQLLRDYVASQVAAGRTVSQIDLGSGTANYRGDPNVVRFAVTPEDQAAFNAANANRPAAQQLPVVGRIFSRTARFENLANSVTSGVDFSVNYTLPQLPFGRLSVATDWSYLIESNQTRTPPGAAPQYVERLNVGGTARWRGTGALTWRHRQWNGSLSAYYVGSFADTSTTTAALYTSLGEPNYISKQFDSGQFLYRFRVRDVTTFNAALGYRFTREARTWLRGTGIRLGVVNLTDREPPLTPGAFGYSSSVHGSLFAGRTWTLELTRQF